MSLTKYPYMPPVCQVNNVDIDLVYSDIIDENIISINSKKELFFDIYECILNDEKLILEKVGESELGPKVLLELNIDGKKYSAEAILVDNGSTYVELNKENIYFIRTIPESNLLEEDEIDEPISDGSDDDKEIDAIDVNYENIIEHHVNNKLVFLHELEEQFEEKIVSLKDDISNKLDLFFEKLEDKKKVIVEEKLEEITLELDEKYKVLKSELHQVEDFSKQNIDNILETKIKEIDSSVGLFLEGITKEYKNKIISSDKKITHNFLELNSIKEKLKENNSTTNKKFTELNLLKEKLLEQDELVLKNEELKKFINEEFENINSKFKNLSVEENKKYEELLAAVNNKDVVEYKTILKEKIQDVELTQIKESLQEEISSALKGDIVSLKRYVEMSSGGGSTAKQFAAGGTMDGTLNVNGNILSGGTNLIDIFNSDTSINLQDVTDNGSTTTNLISSNNTIIANNILATNLLSATNLDIGFELSGFNVTGDLSASGGLSANNINVSGDILPSQTTTFNIGSTALRFKDIFLAGSTIDLSGTKISTDGEGDIEFRDKDNLTKRIKASEIILESPNDPDNDIVFKVDTTGNPEFQKRRRSNPNIIEPSTTISDIVSAAQVRVRDVVGIGTSPSQLPNKPLTVVGEISATGNISTGSNLQLGGNIVDTDANEIITIAGNDVCFTGKSIRAGQSLGLRGVRGNSKGLDQSGGGDHTKLGIFNCSIEAITIDTSGKVGIGSTTPNNELTVVGDISATGNISSGIFHSCNTGGTDTTIATFENTTSTSSDNDANIKIISTGSGESSIQFINSNNTHTGGFQIGHGDVFSEALFFHNKHDNRTDMVIDQSGCVGIGTTTPNEALTVVGNISAADINSFGTISIGNTPAYSQTRAIKVHDNGTQYASRVSLMGTGDNAGPAIEFVTDGSLAKRTLIRHEGEGSNDYGLGFFTTNNGTISEKVRFDGDGNVGIGTTSPSSKLHIVGESGSGSGLEFSNAGSQSVKAYFIDSNSSSDFVITRVGTGAAEISLQSDGEVILNPNNNNVGVGTTSPNENLTVVGNISATGLASVSSLEIISDGSSSSDNSPFKFEVAADRKNTATTALYIYPKDTTNHRVYFQNPAQDRNSYAVNFSGLTQIEDTPAFNNLTAKSTTTNGDNFGLGTVTAGTGVRRSGTTDNFDLFVSHSSNTPDFVFHTKTGGFFSSDSQLDGTNEVMRLTNGGKLGIGTSSPNETLTVVGNISATGTTNVGKITLTENTFLTAASSFTLGDVHKGATVLLQNTGSINITVPSQVAGYTTTFIAETHNPVSFISGTGLSGLNSFNGASDIAGIYGQAQVIYKSAEYAFLGGNIV